jgi:hypothetical protein
MQLEISDTSWVYVVVEDPEKSETILGQEDAESGISFIPFFVERESARQCYPDLTRNRGKKYEVQALLFEDLCRYAADGGFQLFALDAEGHILETYDRKT